MIGSCGRVTFDPQDPHYFSLIALSQVLAGQIDAAIDTAREGHDRNPLGAWNALVYAVAAAENFQMTDPEVFQRLVARTALRSSHFYDLLFINGGMAE